MTAVDRAVLALVLTGHAVLLWLAGDRWGDPSWSRVVLHGLALFVLLAAAGRVTTSTDGPRPVRGRNLTLHPDPEPEQDVPPLTGMAGLATTRRPGRLQ